VCFGVVATVAERSRAQAAQAARAQTEPLLVQAVTLYTELSDANASVTSTFLHGGFEPPAVHQQYLADLTRASDSMAALTREVGTSDAARSAVRTIAEQLPVYSGLVETARSNNRQNLPVGAAYLRQASSVLTEGILPQADRLYAIEATRLRENYATGSSTAALLVLVIAIGAALALLILTQLYLARLSRRVFNVPVALATLVLAGVAVWAIGGLLGEQSSLRTAQRVGSDPVEVLSATSVLASRAQSDQNLTLVSRGTDSTDPKDQANVMRVLTTPGQLVTEAVALVRRTGSPGAADQLARDFAAYQAETELIAGLEKQGLTVDAIRRANPAAANRLNADLTVQTSAAQSRFTAKAADATSSLSGLSIAIPVVAVLGAALALFGLRQRLEEYR
jgi:hypothetical protein